MKKISALLSTIVLYSATATATPPIKVDIQFNNTAENLLDDSVDIIPGLYLRYQKKKFQLLLLNQSMKKNQLISQQVYLPRPVQWVKPILAFQEKDHSLHYWYCKESLSLAALHTNSKRKIAKHLLVRINELPPKTTPRGSRPQTLSCSTQFVTTKTLLIHGDSQ